MKNTKLHYLLKNLPFGFIIVGMISLLVALFFYQQQRVAVPMIFSLFPSMPFIGADIRFLSLLREWDFIQWSLPSALHVIAFSFLTLAVVKRRDSVRLLQIVLFWMLVNVGFEAGQWYFHNNSTIPKFGVYGALKYVDANSYLVHGTFDWYDIIGIFLGGIFALVIFWGLFHKNKNSIVPSKRPIQALLKASVIILGICSITATSLRDDGDKPIYLSYLDLRAAIKGTEAKALENPGKIYVYRDLLFINEGHQGIHVVDNSNPIEPEKLMFIEIPGTIDIAIKDDILFADSFVDLVAIDISNLSEITVKKRIENVFPYDPYQDARTEGCNLYNYDESKGVIIGCIKTRN